MHEIRRRRLLLLFLSRILLKMPQIPCLTAKLKSRIIFQVALMLLLCYRSNTCSASDYTLAPMPDTSILDGAITTVGSTVSSHNPSSCPISQQYTCLGTISSKVSTSGGGIKVDVSGTASHLGTYSCLQIVIDTTTLSLIYSSNFNINVIADCDNSNYLIKGGPYTFNYFIGDPIQTLNTDIITSFKSNCYVTQNVTDASNALPDSSVFSYGSFNSTSAFTIYTNNGAKEAKVTLYQNAQIIGYTLNTMLTIKITVNIINCNNAVLTGPTISPVNYNLCTATTPYTISPFTLDTNFKHDLCPLSYQFLYNSAAVTLSFITYTSLAGTYYSKTISDANVYTFEIKAKVTGYTPTLSKYFVLTLLDPCLSDTITTPTIADKTVWISDAVATVTVTAYTEQYNSGCSNMCGPFTYTCLQSSGSSLPYFMSFNPSNRIITYTPNPAQNPYLSTTYTISYKGCLSNNIAYPCATKTFTVYFKGCDLTTITAPAVGNYVYFVTDAAASFTATAFTESLNVCGAFTYSATLQSGAALPSAISFNPSTRAFSITPSLQTTSIVYTVQLTGQLEPSKGGPSKSITFTVTFTACDTTVITNPTISTQSFNYGNGLLSATLGLFTETHLGACGPFTYTLTLSDGTAIPALLVFSGAAVTLKVQTNSITTSTSYSLKFTGTLPSPAPSSSVTFTINTVGCNSAVITPPTASAQTFIYGNGLKNVVITGSFSSSIATCTPFTYTLTLSSGAALPSIFTFDSTLSTSPTIQTNSITTSTSYTLKLTGTLPSPGTSSSIQFIVTLTGCDSTVITGPTIADQTFSKSASTQSVVISGSFSESLGVCSPFTNTLTLSDGTAYPSAIFTFSSSLLTITIDSSSISATTVYTLKLTGTLPSPGPSLSKTFVITITGCDAAVITGPTISDQTFSKGFSTSAIVVAGSFAVNPSVCTPFTYTLTKSDGSAIPSLIIFTSSTGGMQVDTSLITTTITYNLILKASIPSGPNKLVAFAVTMKGCDSTIITAPTVSDQTFYQNTGTQTVVVTGAFSESMGVCTPFTNTLTLSDGTAYPVIFSFTSTSLLIQISTTSILTTNAYSLKLVGTLPTPGPAKTVAFVVTLTGCDSTVISTTAIADQTFTINQVANTFSGTAYTQTISSCGPITYSSTLQSGAALPALLAFNPTTLVFTVTTTAITTTTTYAVKMIGTLSQTPNTVKVVNFNLNVISCFSTVISVNSITTQTFHFDSSSASFPFSDFTESLGQCGSFTYTSLLQSGSALPSPLFTLNSASKTYSIDRSLITTSASYSIMLTGCLTPYSLCSTFGPFTVTLQACDLTVVSTQAVANQAFIYTSVSPTSTFSFTDWTESFTTCGTFTYSALQLDGSALPGLLTFNPSTKTFSVDRSLILTTITYHIRVTGALSSPGPSKTVDFDLSLQACDLTVITSPSVSAQSYNHASVSGTTSIFNYASWTESFTTCGAFTYTATLADGTALPALVTFNPATNSFTIDQSQISTTQTLSIKLHGALSSPGPSSDLLISVTLVGCDSSVITSNAISNVQYYYTKASTLELISFLDWSESLTTCGAFTYTSTLSGGGVLPSVVSFNAGLKQYTIDRTLFSVSTVLTVELTGSLASPGTSKTISFTITLIGCDQTVISTVSVPNQSYKYKNVATLGQVSFIDWTESIGQCTPFAYSAVLSDGTALTSTLNPLISFDSTSRQFTVDQTQIGLSNVLTVTITGQLPNPGPSATVTFTITLIGCDQAAIVPTTVPNLSIQYTDYTNSTSFSFVDWQETNLLTCGAFTYSSLFSNGTALPASLIAFNPSTMKFTVDQKKIGLTQTVTIVVTGALVSPGTSSTTTFSITLVGCDTSAITTDAIADQSYSYKRLTTISLVTFNQWTDALTTCGSFTYSSVQVGGSALPSILYFNPSNRTFTINQHNILQTTIYHVQVTGTLPAPGNSQSITFTVTLTACDMTVITSQAIPDQTYSYTSSLTPTVFNFTDWSESMGECSPFTYTATLINGLKIPRQVVIDSTNMGILVYTSKITTTYTYSIKMKGQLAYPGPFDYIVFSITLQGCDQSVLTPETIADQTFIFSLTSSLATFSFDEWVPSVATCTPTTYTSYQLRNSASLPTVITFTPGLRTFTVDRSLISSSINYTIVVDGLPATQKKSVKTQFNLILKGCDQISSLDCIVQGLTYNTAPYFQSTVSNLSFELTDQSYKQVIQLPDYVDDQGNAIAFTYNLGDAAKFMTYDKTTNSLIININSILIGSQTSFPISITLTDNSANQQQLTYSFFVNILAKVQLAISANQTNSSNSSSTDAERIAALLKAKVNANQSLSAFISKIFQNGTVLIEFNSTLQDPLSLNISNSSIPLTSYSFINATDLKVELMYNGYESLAESDVGQNYNLNFSWAILDYYKNVVRMQLYFEDPKSISVTQVSNKLKITFLKQRYFLSFDLLKQIPVKTVISKLVPTQFQSQSDMMQMQIMSDSAKYAMTGAVAVSLALGSVSSMSAIFTLLNSGQLILLLPLCSCGFPANAIEFYAMLNQAINLNIPEMFSSQSVFDKIVKFNDENKEPFNQYFEAMHIFQIALIFLPLNSLTIRKHKHSLQLRQLGGSIGNIRSNVGNSTRPQMSFLSRQTVILQLILQNKLTVPVYVQTGLLPVPHKNAAAKLSLLCHVFLHCSPTRILKSYPFQMYFDLNGEILCSILAILFTIVSFLLPMWMYWFLRSFKNKLFSKNVADRFNTMYEKLKKDDMLALCFHVNFTVRRLVFAIIVTQMTDYFYAQLQLLIFSSELTLIYLVYSRPYRSKGSNNLEIFNEVCIFMAVYTLFVFCDFVDNPDYKYLGGKLLIAITLINILVNSLQVVNAWVKAIKIISNFCHNRKKKKAPLEANLNESKYLVQGTEMNLGGGEEKELHNPNTEHGLAMKTAMPVNQIKEVTPEKKGRRNLEETKIQNDESSMIDNDDISMNRSYQSILKQTAVDDNKFEKQPTSLFKEQDQSNQKGDEFEINQTYTMNKISYGYQRGQKKIFISEQL